MSSQIIMDRSGTQCLWLTRADSTPMKAAFLILFLLFIMINHAHAEDDGVTDRFRIAIGGYTLSRYDSFISLTDPDLGAGISISPEDTLGLNTDQAVARIDGNYRFNKKHALTYSWYNISSDGNKTLEETIDWVDENGNEITIPLGASVTSAIDYDIFKVGYLWSFHHTDKVELAFGGGLHVTRISVDMSAESSGSDLNTTDVSTTVPLPVVSFALVYNITPKLSWYLKSEFFALSFGDWKGSYTDSTFGLEYRAWKHVGLGFGLGSNALSLTEDTSDENFVFNNQISGALLYVASYF
ncbi:MAG: hypothetical protein ACN4GM_02890 [Gammaproteobacteria bacterium]